MKNRSRLLRTFLYLAGTALMGLVTVATSHPDALKAIPGFAPYIPYLVVLGMVITNGHISIGNLYKNPDGSPAECPWESKPTPTETSNEKS